LAAIATALNDRKISTPRGARSHVSSAKSLSVRGVPRRWTSTDPSDSDARIFAGISRIAAKALELATEMMRAADQTRQAVDDYLKAAQEAYDSWERSANRERPFTVAVIQGNREVEVIDFATVQ
jgi:hypothetical protein